MSHIVTCFYCHQRFDRDKEPTTQVSVRRYAHQNCAEEAEKNKTQEERDLEALEKYIKEKFNTKTISAKIKRQIQDYKEKYNYSYSGILKSLIYFFDIKGNSIEKANKGIGIVPYVWDESYNYFLKIYLAEIKNQEKDIQNFNTIVNEIEIFSPIVEKSVFKEKFILD
jgi:uncharacterized protein YprB with RNaseH-like and TPR domain